MNADLIIEKIDNGELSPSSHEVVRRLCDLITYPEKADVELISAFDRGEMMRDERWMTNFWKRIDALPMPQQGALRILWGLVHADEQVDWYLAGCLIHWAREQGVTDQDIVEAFGVAL